MLIQFPAYMPMTHQVEENSQTQQYRYQTQVKLVFSGVPPFPKTLACCKTYWEMCRVSASFLSLYSHAADMWLPPNSHNCLESHLLLNWGKISPCIKEGKVIFYAPLEFLIRSLQERKTQQPLQKKWRPE